MGMTDKQRRFAEAVLSGASPAEAARLAGYGGHAARVLKQPEVRRYIDARQNGAAHPARAQPEGEQAEAADGFGAVATEREVLEFLTGVMRGEGDAEGRGGASPRMKAAELLGKRLGIFNEVSDGAPPPVIIDDIPAGVGDGR